MISIKGGTQNYANPSAQDQMYSNRAGSTKQASAQDLKDMLGDTAIGDYLNELSDPNYVDPLKKVRTAGKNELDRDAFFKLMIQQMKSQDPTNPMQSHEMAAQLAQFSSVEQLNNIHTTLNQIKQEQKPALQFQALSMIGKTVSGDSSQVIRVDGDKGHELQFSIPVEARELQVDVKNEQGEVVRQMKLRNLKPGQQSHVWNGLMENGQSARPGTYFFDVSAVSALGKKIPVQTDFSGAVTGVNFSAQGPILLVGEKTIRLSDVRKIVDTSSHKDSGLGVESAKSKPIGNLESSVMMEGGMLDKLNKEVSLGSEPQ